MSEVEPLAPIRWVEVLLIDFSTTLAYTNPCQTETGSRLSRARTTAEVRDALAVVQQHKPARRQRGVAGCSLPGLCFQCLYSIRALPVFGSRE